MRAISLWQPWATLIATGSKRIETRSWSTPYRGPLAIHAARRWTAEEQELEQYWPFGDVLDMRFWNDPPLGCVVAVADLVNCIQVTHDLLVRIEERLELAERQNRPSEYHFGHYEIGRWMWLLADVRKLEHPIPCRGMQGLWEWEMAA